MKIPKKNEGKFLGPDLRKELEYLSISSFRWMALRSVNYKKPCSCKGNDPACNRCMRTGYLFTDFLVKAYPWQATMGVLFNSGVKKISTSTLNIVLEHDRAVNKRDMILELLLDDDTGKPKQPLQVVRVYEVQDVIPMIGDEARKEFWKCTIEERNVDDGRPGSRGTGYNYSTNRDKI